MTFILSILISTITLGSVYMVPTGHVGVITQFGKVVFSQEAGIHAKRPLGLQSVYNYDVRVQKDDVKAEAASKDLQIVTTDIVVNWHISPSKADEIFAQVGGRKDVVDKIIGPAVSEVVKATTAKKNAEEIITKRPELKADIDAHLEKRLAPYGIVLDDVSLVNIDFSPEFNKAIEDKQIAEQQAKQAQYIADKAVKDAEAAVNKAKGEAEAQRLQQETLTEPLLRKLYLEKWNGKLPNVVTEGSTLLIKP